MKTHLHYFIMFYFHMEGIALIDVIRRQDGDVEKILSCKGGTVVARHDETHTLFCANNLKEAGCDLVFVNSMDVGFVPSDRTSFTGYEITSLTGSLCSGNNKPSIGDVSVQDYPKNLKANVWSDKIGSVMVKNCLNFTDIQINKLKVKFPKQFPGLLLKIVVNCSNNQVVNNDDDGRNCVMVKYEGYSKYPLTEQNFGIPTTPAITTTTSTTVGLAAIIKDDDDTLIYALLASLTCGFFITVIFITVVVICKRRRRKRMQGSSNNRSEDVENQQQQQQQQQQQVQEEQDNEKQQRREHKQREKEKRQRQKQQKIQEEQQLKQKEQQKRKQKQQEKQKQRKQQQQQKRVGKQHNVQLHDEHVLQFSPVISTDSRTPTFSNTYAIETSGAHRKTDIYVGEDSADSIPSDDDHVIATTSTASPSVRTSKNMDKFKMQKVKFGRGKRTTTPKITDNYFTEFNVENSSNNNNTEALQNDYIPAEDIVTSSPRDNLKDSEHITHVKQSNVEFYEQAFSNDENTPKCLERLDNLQENCENSQINDAYDEDGSEARIKPLYVEGQLPADREEDDLATSESIEAMFSFSNELENSIDEIASEREEEKEMTKDDEEVDFSSFLTRKKHKRNPLFNMSNTEEEEKTQDMLMF